MTDEPSESSPPPSATATGNQNLIIGLILGAVVLLLFLLVLQMIGGGFGGPSELDKLKAERDAKQKALTNNRGLNPAGGDTPQDLANRLTTDSAKLAGLVTQLQAMLTKAQTDLNAANSTVQTLSSQLASSTNSAAENATLKNQLAAAQTRASNAESQLSAIQQQLAQAPSATEVSLLQKELEAVIKARDGLQGQVAQMSEQLRGSESSAVASTLREDLATMTENASTLTRQNNALRYEVQTLRSRLNRTRLFVEKVDDLPAAAKELFVELSKLETTEGAVLQHEYDRIKKEVGANIIDTIKFSTGSSQVSLDKVEEITRVVGKANPQSYFLVVGYASKTGNFEDNKKLSAERATTIASVVDYKKMDTQGIQAVFLGQTDRFSGSDVLQNQICEVWEIMP